ncbi:DNA protecting protein DprA [Candidatus Gottesmanbacteria bacterium RIFCSPLOWO2_01_FULL_39_12b]|uniref:DNA protecting protein DprA n=1 Tax=Candidatus Gottesmanbacteria bacterium RIFCSPLOWO2_01_FULL_39_12b TaxID=1798388 RepID=A0A1F6AQX2_9BACT|nr:MAG: DNA protecting protein DprA [Candidatus Gottesmanbacteria bacterium RIFCSPLOWO2_01_FULL_39_12b]
MIDEEKKYWLGFSAFPGIGPLRFKLLHQYFGDAQKAWEASEKELVKIGLGEMLTGKFVAFRQDFSFEKYQKRLLEKEIAVITLLDKEYPDILKEIPAAPFLLYTRGNLDTFKGSTFKRVAVVGTRRITNYGREITRKITEGLVDFGITVVSGMAYGVDTVAHETAVELGGKTIAVLGCGVDIIHPISNSKLYWQIIKKAGLVISEYPLGQYATRGLFPARNRIISGLSQGVVVTEGASDSGALITASYAAEQGREVFAVPGPITSEMSGATNKLLKSGAKLVTEAKDILEELKIKNIPINKYPSTQMNEKMQKLSNEERKIIELLQKENLHFDEIARQTKMETGKLGSLLTMMEMKKYIKNLGGGNYGIA